MAVVEDTKQKLIGLCDIIMGSIKNAKLQGGLHTYPYSLAGDRNHLLSQRYETPTGCAHHIRMLPNDILEDCRIYDNILLWSMIKSRGRRGEFGYNINFKIQALCCDAGESIIDLIKRKHPKLQYYRLDFHPEECGEIFTHPSVHLHTSCDGAPRLHMSSNSLVSFFELLLLNHRHVEYHEFLYSLYSNGALSESCPEFSFENWIELVERYKSVIHNHNELYNDNAVIFDAVAIGYKMELMKFQKKYTLYNDVDLGLIDWVFERHNEKHGIQP